MHEMGIKRSLEHSHRKTAVSSSADKSLRILPSGIRCMLPNRSAQRKMIILANMIFLYANGSAANDLVNTAISRTIAATNSICVNICYRVQASSRPVSILYAWRYLSIVLSTISWGSVQSWPSFALSQSLANCLSNEGCECPGSYTSAGQKRELSGVSISSPTTIFPFSSSPNSNFVSAIIIPFLSA